MKRFGVIGVAAAAILVAGAVTVAQGPVTRPTLPGPDRVQAAKMVDSLPLSFIPNAGQAHPDVSYYLAGASNSLYFSPGGMTYALGEPSRVVEPAKAELRNPKSALPARPQGPGNRWAVKVDYLGANPVVPQASNPRNTKISYFKGNQAEQRTALATYGEVAYKDLWPGIDLVYSGNVNKLKYDFVVHPGADPSQIRLGYRGATAMTIDAEGALAVTT
ncbi:MAG: hypothetical protein ACRDRT_18285, partial [Pseudonocardiaceae bacterium]